MSGVEAGIWAHRTYTPSHEFDDRQPRSEGPYHTFLTVEFPAIPADRMSETFSTIEVCG